MTTKALKKQLAAAIAMVLVAGVALSSSTYAWFVSNNSVEATTTTISAMSNAPFLQIKYDADAVDEESGTADLATTPAVDTALYPAQVINSGDDPLFQSAYAAAKTAATELTGSRFDVGTPDDANDDKYALKYKFAIGTSDEKAGSFEDLVMDTVKITTEGSLDDEICVLAVGEDGWSVMNAAGIVQKYADNTAVTGKNDGVLANTIDANNSTVVYLYVFYDGSMADIKTSNLENLLEGTGVTVTFTAKAVSTNGTVTTATNNVNP